MQRVKAPEGRLTLDQWQGLAALAARYTPEYSLHVTTRQNLELHGLPSDGPLPTRSSCTLETLTDKKPTAFAIIVTKGGARVAVAFSTDRRTRPHRSGSQEAATGNEKDWVDFFSW